MDKIDELIQQYCPDGVEFVQIKNIAKCSMGEFVHKSKQDPNAPYPVYNGGITNTGFYKEYNTEENKVIVSARGAGAGFVNVIEQKFWAGNSCHIISVYNAERTNYKYLFYALKNIEDGLIGNQQKGGIPAISKTQLETTSIPLPPLPVQEAIVNILDRFAEYAAELQAELQARQQQYNYYRDTLLSFEGRTDVQWKKLEDVFELRNGYTPSKNNPEFWIDGTIPWYRMEDIRVNGRILKDSIQHITPLAIKGKGLFEANSFIIATTATIGEHALLIADSLANQQFTNLKIRESLTDKLDVKFVFYYLFVVDEFCKSHVNISGFASVDMEAFKRMQFPIPSLSEQQRIVNILDRFDILINDLSQGLPAEIEARQQEYEYYRDQLLTFKRKEA